VAQLQESLETLPIIDVRLSPPANPLPEVSAEIQALEKARDALEQEKMAKLEAAYNAALEGAKIQISDAVGSAMFLFQDDVAESRSAPPASFLASRGGGARVEAAGGANVKVKVLTVPPPDASIKSKLDAMEAKRTGLEAQVLDQAVQEMAALTEVVVRELKESLQLQMSAFSATEGLAKKSAGTSFLETKVHDEPGMPAPEGLPAQLNVRVGASEVPYPTIAGLAQDMETRRDTAENLEKQKILDLERKLLEAENEYIKGALQGAVGSLLVRSRT
jgi:hypothetical protein